MNGKYFTLLTLFVALSLNLSAQRVINNVVRNADKCAVTPAQKSISDNNSYLVNVKVAKNDNSARALKKYALAEEFTNASCPPCAAQNPAYNALLANNTENVIAVKYQVWFPGYDPMFETNKSEVEARWNVYQAYTTGLYGQDNGMGGVPTAFIDGYMGNGTYGGGNWSQAYYGAPAGYNQASLTFAASTESQLDIEVNHNYNQNLDSILVTVEVSNNSDSLFTNTDYKLHALVLEAQLDWPVAPGTNGEKAFEHVFRKAASNVNGDDVMPDTLGAGNTVSFTYGIPIASYFFALDQIEAVAFLQRTSNLSIMNASISEPVDYPAGAEVGDASVTNSSVAEDALCPDNYVAEPKITVKNNNFNQEVITQVTAAYILNGVTYTKDFDTNIEYNQSEVLSFGEIAVEGGNNTISVGLISFNNGTKDGNLINNITTDFGFTFLSEEGVEAPVTVDIEGSSDMPEDLFLDVPGFPLIFPATPTTITPVANRGAYAESENSILFFFYQWNPDAAPATVSITHDKVNLPSNPIYSFDFAYAGYTEGGTTYDQDKLEFYYSTDCGDSWTKFKTLQGSTLKTAPNQAGFFAPSATQWKSDTTRLDALANATDVVFQVRATTDWGNNAYLDNLFVGQDPAISAVTKINSFDNVSVYPNPASDNLTIKINALSPSNVSIKLLDYTGKLVQTLNNNQSIQGGLNNLSFNVSNFSNGMYLIKIENKEGVSIQPVSIVR